MKGRLISKKVSLPSSGGSRILEKSIFLFYSSNVRPFKNACLKGFFFEIRKKVPGGKA